jgi:ABC-type transporter Mla maintaining outer membrane lipid asymmetry ATPase subunit MlaF
VNSHDVIFNTKGLTKSFKECTAVDNVNLSVERGSIQALIGPIAQELLLVCITILQALDLGARLQLDLFL